MVTIVAVLLVLGCAGCASSDPAASGHSPMVEWANDNGDAPDRGAELVAAVGDAASDNDPDALASACQELQDWAFDESAVDPMPDVEGRDYWRQLLDAASNAGDSCLDGDIDAAASSLRDFADAADKLAEVLARY